MVLPPDVLSMVLVEVHPPHFCISVQKIPECIVFQRGLVMSIQGIWMAVVASFGNAYLMNVW